MNKRFGHVEQMPQPAQWLCDNGSGYIARDTRAFARDIGLIACRTPYRSPQSNGMAEAFVKAFKRDYVSISPTSDGPTVMRHFAYWFADLQCGASTQRLEISFSRPVPTGSQM